MTETLTRKYGLLWHTTQDEAVSAGTSHGGPSHREGEDVAYVDMLLRLSPNGPYSTIAATEPPKGSDGTLKVLHKAQGTYQHVSFHKVEAGLYEFDGSQTTTEAAG